MKFEYETGKIPDILDIAPLIPEFESLLTSDVIEARLQGKRNLILVAKHEDKPIGFKIGYEVFSNQFYSWLGGVIPCYRKMKVASKLRSIQESWAKENGFESISVKSMNRFPAMLQMLIASGYQMSGYEDRGSVSTSKINFIKVLV
ncbi:MAG: GNAT family N-acetyltransferase [Aliiglaciecola sp.]|uniref:GNAT family N-acetyltransferase n=1 Tax=Aliiglaciecola sp. TaxID=1872441 RepID=UPI00329688F1